MGDSQQNRQNRLKFRIFYAPALKKSTQPPAMAVLTNSSYALQRKIYGCYLQPGWQGPRPADSSKLPTSAASRLNALKEGLQSNLAIQSILSEPFIWYKRLRAVGSIEKSNQLWLG